MSFDVSGKIFKGNHSCHASVSYMCAFPVPYGQSLSVELTSGLSR